MRLKEAPARPSVKSSLRQAPTIALFMALIAATGGPALTEECPPERVLHGAIRVGDNSQPLGDAFVGGGQCGEVPGSGWGAVDFCPNTAAACTFHAWQSDYLPESASEPTAWCSFSNGILTCAPQDHNVFDFTLYSEQGYIDGTITSLPSGRPVQNSQIGVQRRFGTTWVNAAATHTDLAGYYTFHDGGPNNWGLYVGRPPGASGPGSADYRARHGLQSDWGHATISSNTRATINIQRKDPGYEEPARCDSCQQPPMAPSPSAAGATSTGPSAPAPGAPCTVGQPVSVTNGNVDLDQTDAVIPGQGLGLRFTRSYNSKNIDAGEYGVFGPGWSHSYEKRLTFPATGIIKLRSGDGMPYFYQDLDTVDGTFVASMPFSKESQIVRVSPTEYILSYRRGGSETYVSPSAGATARLVSLTDASGNVTTLLYDTLGRLVTVADPGGRQLTLTYAGSGLLPDQLAGPDGLIATFTFTTSGASTVLQTVTYADGDGDMQADAAYTFAYHPGGQLWTVTDGAGKVLETHLYTGDRATETSRSGDVEKYTLAYDEELNITTVTDSLGNVTTYHWQNVWGARRVLKITGPCSGCGGGGGEVQEWTYDLHGRVTSHKNGEGNVTRYEYEGTGEDPDDNVKTVTLPPGGLGSGEAVTTYTYHPDGRMHTRLAPNGGLTTWTYEAAGPATITETVSTGVSRTTSITYTQGKPHVITDPLGKQTEMHYTSLGDLEWVQDPIGITHRTTFEYDAMGRLEKTNLPATTPPNDSPRTSYDTLGRVWRVTNPNGSFSRHWYDRGGRRILSHDPDGEPTAYQYDDYGRLWKVVDALGGETEYQYDLMSNLVALIDARDKKTSFEYDGYHRVKKITYPSPTKPAPFEQFTYDQAGRLKTRRDRKGVTLTFTYDQRGRLTDKAGPGGSLATYGYDANGDVGFMTSATNSADTLSWDYDLAGQLLSEGSASNDTTVSYLYDLAGRRTHLRLNGANVLTYGYHDDGELDTITRAPGVVFDFNPDAAHRRQSLVFPNGTTTEYGYDLLSRLSLVRLKKGALVLNEIAYDSNDLNNRTSRTENGTRLEYGYDDLSRLETVDRTTPTPTVRQEEYTYDAVGNRLSVLGIPGAWSYSDRNELLVSYHATNGVNFTYDLNGNQISRDGTARTYVWDVENRLTSAKDNGVSVADFSYDPLGRRVTKTTSAGLTRFIYDGEDILAEQGPSGNFTYLHGPGIDEPLAREATGGVRTYYHADGLGSIVKRTDASGNVLASDAYDSFGRPAVAPPNGYAFTSREWDAETGLYYYRARYYDPKIGRFVSEDPSRFEDGINLYRYVHNNPTRFVDPTGRTSAALSGLISFANECCRPRVDNDDPCNLCRMEPSKDPSPWDCTCRVCDNYPQQGTGKCPKTACKSYPWPDCILGLGGPFDCFSGEPNPDYPDPNDP